MRSERVKSVDLFPAEQPWVLTALYSGHCVIYDYTTSVRGDAAVVHGRPPQLTLLPLCPYCPFAPLLLCTLPVHGSCLSRALRCAKCQCAAPSLWSASSGSLRGRTTCTCACTTTTRWRKSRCAPTAARLDDAPPSMNPATPTSPPTVSLLGVGRPHRLHPVRGSAPQPAVHHQLVGRHVHQGASLVRLDGLPLPYPGSPTPAVPCSCPSRCVFGPPGSARPCVPRLTDPASRQAVGLGAGL